MLKNIDPILTGDLLAILRDMGHGDEIVISDRNFPSTAIATRLVRMPGLDADRVVQAIVSVMPLDEFVPKPAIAMASPDGRPAIRDAFDAALTQGHGGAVEVEEIERFAFYDRAKTAFAVVATGESRLYANLILKKGIVR
ncbi:ribose ABC transporter [Jiella sp. MQZ9-1]|uniref:Ribose ABC transporter n=1 Tax=Jiella flava TaxID=2816857 RepID=A0A939FZ37_9HYPH|nr:RbsD/FucU domain-containing protein [Jiella flava]MBO0662861.1 ribose ABC transporter [Jiella flava]MCD2471379.1 ribose ABC transporter [Jiella flava]